ncbi:MAG: gliding motility-associated C-terminal domain-containing protein [Prevotella sp.]|nr:gliding motility-associated C-terminal domain-containing protein [Prevotella sp.]
MKIKHIIALFCVLLMPVGASAEYFTAIYNDTDGSEGTTSEDFTAEAPLHVRFVADTSLFDDGAALEWHFRHTGSGGNTAITRYGSETEYDFTESGLTVVSLIIRMDGEAVDSASMRVTISESHLEMPNAFSPNGDGVNDYFQAKSNYKSIVDFHAYIFNRWGQKLYDWTDFADEKKGWDGTYRGTPVKDGVYFVLVKARGADGRKYEIKRDVNLLRKYNETTTTGGGTGNE